MAELDSLFGSIEDIRRAKATDRRAQALQLAQLQPGRASVYAAGLGGGMLGAGLGRALGLKSPLEQKQTKAQEILLRNKELDPNSPKTFQSLGKQFTEAGMPGIGQTFLEKSRTMTTDQAAAVLDPFKAATEEKKALAAGVKAEADMIKAQNDQVTPVVKEMGVPGDSTKTQYMQWNPTTKEWNPITSAEGKKFIKQVGSSGEATKNAALNKAYDAIVGEYGRHFCDSWDGNVCMAWSDNRPSLEDFFKQKPAKLNGFSGTEIYDAVQSGLSTEHTGTSSTATPGPASTAVPEGQYGYIEPGTGWMYVGDNWASDSEDPNSWLSPDEITEAGL